MRQPLDVQILAKSPHFRALSRRLAWLEEGVQPLAVADGDGAFFAAELVRCRYSLLVSQRKMVSRALPSSAPVMP
jgi:hypothetical protein